MRQLKAQPETPRITKLANGDYHIAGEDGDTFDLEGLSDLVLYYHSHTETVTVEMPDGYEDEDGEFVRDNYIIAERNIEDEPETEYFEITITRAQLEEAKQYRAENPD